MVLKRNVFILAALLLFSLAANAQTPNEPSGLNRNGQELIDKGHYREAKRVFLQAMELGTADAPTIEYAKSLAGYARTMATSDLDKADSLYNQALAIIQAISGSDDPEYAQTLQQLADTRIVAQKLDGMEEMLNTVFRIQAKHFGTQSATYAETLGLLCLYYIEMSDFEKAEAIINQSFEIISNLAPNSFTHGKLARTAVLLYFAKQDYEQGESYCKQAIEILKKTTAPSNRELMEAKGTLSILYAQTGRFKESEQAIMELMPIIEQDYGKEDFSYSILLSTLGSIYAFTGRMEESLSIFEESIQLNKRIFGEKHHSYVNAINTLAIIYINTDRFELAEPLLKETLKLREELYGIESPSYVNGLNNLATLYQYMGNDARASELLLRVIELSKRVLGESTMSHILALSNMATCCKDLKLYDKAIQYADSVEILLNRYNLTDKPEFAQIRGNNLAVLRKCGKIGPDFAQQMKEHAELLKSLNGEHDIIYQNLINELCIYYYNIDDHQPALHYAEIACRIVEKHRGVKTTAYSYVVSNKGSSQYKLHQWAEAEASFTECLSVVKELAQQNFSFMSDRERNEYWISIKRSLYKIEDFVGYAAENGYDSPALHELVYNYTLFTKALLLNYSTDIQQSILRSGDRELIAVWEQLKTLKADPDKNQAEIEALNKQLVLGSMAYRDQQKAFSATWQDVRDNLGADEAAIEVTALVSGETHPVRGYYGLVLRRESTSPELLFLCTEEELETALNTSGHDGSGLYELLFAPMEQHLDGVKRIYIAGNGLVNRLSFAGMKYDEGYLLDQYSICNLLSTKDITRAKQHKQQITEQRNIVLFGGADFGLSTAELARSESDRYTADKGELTRALSQIDLSRGQGFDYLPGSKKEVTDIGKILSKKGWKTTVYTDNLALESRFKSLSSQGVDVIHISTHGYYFPLKEVEEGKTPDNIFKASADPLIRSGLLFSGANGVWSRGIRTDSIDDGVLTGYEIALMDLSSTGLVVLSACNTALGDIDYWEGVYGLQRAFRMAGVGSILVSLWEIPDAETTIFMKEFYRNLRSDAAIRDAFDTTMCNMRNAYPSDPTTWAGFVLIE